MTAEQIDEITARLQGAAERLRSGDLAAEEAADLLEECAALAGRAGSDLASAVSAAGAPMPLPRQDRLL